MFLRSAQFPSFDRRVERAYARHAEEQGQSRIAKAKQAEIGMARMRKGENGTKIARGIQLDLTKGTVMLKRFAYISKNQFIFSHR